MNSLRLRRRLLVRLALLAGVGFLAVLALGQRSRVDGERIAVPVPLPVYEIEAVSGTHVAHLLNLPLPNVGVPQMPIPVDINGDLLPDVTVSVNLINAEGVFSNPPNLGKVIAPNVEINRLITAPVLTPGADPLRINAKLTIVDLQGTQPNTIVRFGYDTGKGGSIPPNYKAVLGGLNNFFDPLVARIDTTNGILLGIDPGLADLGLVPNLRAYEGPLTTFAGFQSGSDNATLDLGFRSMPDIVELGYGSDDEGQHFTFSHASPLNREVDLDILGTLDTSDLDATIKARIDRLPRQIALDVLSSEDGGGVSYVSNAANGRLPDLSAEVQLDGVLLGEERHILGRIDAESLPTELGARWQLSEDQPPAVFFEGSGQGIGAIEARVQNFDNAPTQFEPYVPKSQQYIAIQAGPGGILKGETLVQARLERIRSAEVTTTSTGAIVGSVHIGDGERPLEVHGEIDLRDQDSPYIEATATISPLPDSIDFSITPTAGTPDPDNPDDPVADSLTITYRPSESIDVDTDALVAMPDTVGDVVCGEPGTACGSFDIRNIPTSVEARVVNFAHEARVEIDAEPRAGGAPLDVFGEALVGPIDELGGPADQLLAAPIRATLDVQGLPEHFRFRLLEDEGQSLNRVDVRTCDLDYTTAQCVNGTDTERVADVAFTAANWIDRPTGFPAPPQSGPLYLTVVARGLPDTNDLINFEATGRLRNFKELTYLGTGDLQASRVDIGEGQSFRTFVDIDDLDLDGGDPDDGRIDIDADVQVNPLPTPLTFCFAENGRPIPDTPLDPITAACESADPFGDGTATTEPMTIAYSAPEPFDVISKFAVSGDLPVQLPDDAPIDFGTFNRVAASLSLTDIPGELVAYIATPAETAISTPDGDVTATRVRTVAPGADQTKLDLSVSMTTEGADCADPDPTGGAICAGLLVDGLPEYSSALLATTTSPDATDESAVDQRFEVYGCDRQFFAASPDCAPGTEGSIGVIDLNLKAHAGSPAGVPVYVPPADQPHVFGQVDLDDTENFAAEAGVRIEDLRAVTFRQNPDGNRFSTDVGDGTEPLTVHGLADFRDADDIFENKFLVRGIADLVLTPLPQTFSYEQSGPGANQTDPTHFVFDASSNVLLDFHTELMHADGGPNCGDSATVCGDLRFDKIPAHVEGDLLRTSGPIAGTQRTSDTELHIDLTPFHETDPKPDITASIAMGVPHDVPVIGSEPLFADLSLIGIPLHITVDLQSKEVLKSTDDGLTVRDSSVERFQFFACDRNLEDDVCEDDTEGLIDLIEASARTVDIRPTDFPAPPAPGPGVPPAYISLAGRSGDLEAYVRFPEISEVQFLNRDGVLAATADIFGSTPTTPVNLGVNIDVQDLAVADELSLGDLNYKQPALDVKTALTVEPFPGDLSFCVREGGIRPLPAAVGVDYAVPCEDDNPFGDESPLQESPLSIAFNAETTFDVNVDAELTLDGVDENDVALPTTKMIGHLKLGDVPNELTFHFLQPRETVVPKPGGGFTIEPRGQFRGLLSAPEATSGIDVEFGGAQLIGDGAACEDPRPTVSATCFAANLSNVPTEVSFLYDPDLSLQDAGVDPTNLDEARNLFVYADGPEDEITIDSVYFSRVKPKLQDDGSPVTPLASDVIVADIDLGAVPLPIDVRGTIFLPEGDGDLPTIDLENQNGIILPNVTVDVRSYIAPNPFIDYDKKYELTGGLPKRSVTPKNGEPVYTLSLLQRGDAMRLHAELPAVQRVSARAVLDTDRNPIGTFAVDIGFATDFNIRAFVDLAPDQTMRIYSDALIEDIPANMSLCYRGARSAEEIGKQPFPGMGTWCDSSEVRDDEGAVEFAQLPNMVGRRIDIDAFARIQLGGGSLLVTGRVDLDGMPQVVRMRLPGKVLQFESFDRVLGSGTLVPQGIDKIAFQAATFDLPPADVGYPDYAANLLALPYPFQPRSGAPFPAAAPPADGREFVHVAAIVPTKEFHVRGQLGRTDGQPSSQLERLYYAEEPCGVPVDNRADFPHLPTNDGTSHTCIAARFDPDSAGVNPLSLKADVDVDDETTIRLRDAGLSDIPGWFQVNVADANPFQDTANQRGWRRPCGPHGDAFPNCMAPLLQFDAENGSAVLFGAAEVGARGDLNTVLAVDPTGVSPSFDNVPTAAGWDGAFTNDLGARVRIVDFPSGPFLNPYKTTRTAISGTFRLPVPHSITVDTPQKFQSDAIDRTEKDKKPVKGNAADDIRFRVSVHGTDGNPLGTDPSGETLGDFALYKATANRVDEMLVTRPCALGPVPDEVVNFFGGDLCPGYSQGIPLPGEMGIALYQRTNLSPLGPESDKKTRTSEFMQVDGRLSAPMSAAIRMRTKGKPDVVASALNVPGGFGAAENADPGLPTFRLRFEKIDDGDTAEDSKPPSPPSNDASFDFFSIEEITTNISGIYAAIDFHPDPSRDPAKRVDAVAYTQLGFPPKVGIDLDAHSSLEGNTDLGLVPIDASVLVQIDKIRLVGSTKWNLPFSEWGRDAVDWIISHLLPVPGGDWLGHAIGWLVGELLGIVEEILEQIDPFHGQLDGSGRINLALDDVSHFQFRSSFLHATSEKQGPGTAYIGVDLSLSQLFFGVTFDIPEIPLPTGLLNDIIDAVSCVVTLGLACDNDFVPEKIPAFSVPLFTYGFLPVGYLPFEVPLLMDYRDCDALGGFLSIVPFAGGGFDNVIEVEDNEEFAIWPGSNPEIGLGGVVPIVLGLDTPGTGLLVNEAINLVIGMIAGPVLCSDIFEIGVLDYPGILTSTTDPASYNPGNVAGQDEVFPGHPVPGQPGVPVSLPPESQDPTGRPVIEPITIISPPTVEPVSPPDPRPSLYSGPDVTLSTPVALCGEHEFNTLIVDTAVTVASTADPTIVPDVGEACPEGSEGTLELRANELSVTDDGSITGNEIMTDVAAGTECPDPPVPPPAPPCVPGDNSAFQATGSSGGTNAGVGFDGSEGHSADIPISTNRDPKDAVSPGGPGSAIADGFTRDNQTGPIDSAGDPGLGGGAIILRADSLLALDGPLSVNGGDAAGDLTGACDSDEFEDPSNDIPIYDESDPPQIIGYEQVSDDPPYEHVGVIGSGGGAGGGILLQARTKIDVLGGGSMSAHGGNGGDGLLGAGGGGGGGVIRVVAPIVDGIAQDDLTNATFGGLNGATAPSGDTPCAGVIAPAVPKTTYQGTEYEVETDGFGVLFQPPSAELAPYGPFWWKGGPQSPAADAVKFTGYVTGGGAPNPVTVVACAVRLSGDDLPPGADAVSPNAGAVLEATKNLLPKPDELNPLPSQGELPTVDAPCGSRPGSDILEMGRMTFSNSVEAPAAGSEIDLGAAQSGYYGLYTTAIRPQTEDNDCFTDGDVNGVAVDDGDDCIVEPLDGIEWAVGIDADGPSLTVNTPADPSPYFYALIARVGQIDIDLDAVDPLAGVFSDFLGNAHALCRIRPGSPSGAGLDIPFTGCASGTPFPVPTPDGHKILEVKAVDQVGNESAVVTRHFYLAQGAPNSTLTFTGGSVGSNSWYTTPPGLHFADYDSVADPAESPYAFQVDNGLETPCGPVSDPDGESPWNIPCDVPADALSGLLPGDHTVYYTAIAKDGKRYANDSDPFTATPMPTKSLKFDNKAPLVAVNAVGRPDQVFGSQPWFSYRPFVVVSAIDQFGASGVASVEIRFGTSGSFSPFDITNPPTLPIGVTTVCGRATDNAGLTSATECTTLNADGEAPTFTFTPSAAPTGGGGWYLTPPSVTAANYVDQPVPGGVGADSKQFRTRVDNSGYTDCNAPSCVIPAAAFATTGQYLVHASAVDRFDNRAGEKTLAVKVDLEAPTVQAVIGPVNPDGQHGWWHTSPFLTLLGDDGDGSGVATLEYSLNNGATYTPWTAPVRVAGGQHTLCWRGTDIAGRTSTPQCQSLFVDLADPSALITAPPDPTSGWFAAPVAGISASASDPVPGAGLGTNASSVCENLNPPSGAVNISGLCIAFDGGLYHQYTGTLTAGEGVHTIRAYSVDKSGRRSAVVERIIRVDRSAPVTTIRTQPPDPAQNGWFRAKPLVILRATDGNNGSGLQKLQYRLSPTAPWLDYTGPFVLGEGTTTVYTQAIDKVNPPRLLQQTFKVDITPPTARATNPSKTIFVPLLGQTVNLNYVLGDNLSGNLKVSVSIFSVTGEVVRRIDAGTIYVAPGTTVTKSVTWDGKNQSITSILPVGAYYYRVVVTDEAGNTAESGEGKPVTIRVL